MTLHQQVSFISYGQTGAGKTFTMMGGGEGEEGGIIQRALASVLDALYKQQVAARSSSCLCMCA